MSPARHEPTMIGIMTLEFASAGQTCAEKEKLKLENNVRR